MQPVSTHSNPLHPWALGRAPAGASSLATMVVCSPYVPHSLCDTYMCSGAALGSDPCRWPTCRSETETTDEPPGLLSLRKKSRTRSSQLNKSLIDTLATNFVKLAPTVHLNGQRVFLQTRPILFEGTLFVHLNGQRVFLQIRQVQFQQLQTLCTHKRESRARKEYKFPHSSHSGYISMIIVIMGPNFSGLMKTTSERHQGQFPEYPHLRWNLYQYQWQCDLRACTTGER